MEKTKRKLRHLNLMERVIAIFIAFFICFAIQLYFNEVRIIFITEPQNRLMETIQDISAFISNHEESLSAYSSYRWDYGDSDEFSLKEEERLINGTEILSRLSVSISSSLREEYLLYNAAHAYHETYKSLSMEIMALLKEGKRQEASLIYYNDLYYCGEYLSQNMQVFLEKTISSTRVTFDALTEKNREIDSIQTLLTLVFLLLSAFFALNIVALLSSVKRLSRQALAIGKGEYDIPDLPLEKDMELAHMADAFNEMKHAMVGQMHLLEERNRIQEELFEKDKEALELQNLLESERLQQLRSQINPHFLFNTLNVIKMSASDENASQTEAMISSLAELYRYALGSNSESVTVASEIRIAVALSSLYKVRFGDRIAFSWENRTDEELSEIMVPSFIIQPLVENSFRHGILPLPQGGEVAVVIDKKDGLLSITIRDNGMGMDEETAKEVREKIENNEMESEHIGMSNVARRVRMVSPEASFSFSTEEGKGTEIEIRMPLVLEKGDEE